MNDKPVLTRILEEIITKAIHNPHVPVKKNLKNGLRMTLTADTLGITLYLQGDDVLPSDNEIKTILKYFPYYTGEVPVTELHYDGKPSLRLEIKTPQEVAKYL